MPDTLTPLQPAAMPENASPEQVFAHFQAADPSQAAPAPEQPKPETTKAPEQPASKPDDIPEQFLTGVKPDQQPQPEDEYEKLMSTEPTGQLKHDDWKRYKAAVGKKVDALTKQLQEREAKLAEAEKRGVPEEISKKLEQYEKTLAERDRVLERVAVQESEKFKPFLAREKALSENLKAEGVELGLDVDQLDLALKSSPKRRSEILDTMEMGETTRASLVSIMKHYDFLQSEKAEFLNQSKEVHAKWQQEQQQVAQQQEQQRAAFEKQVFQQIGEEVRKSFAPYQRVEGNDAWNAQAEALEAEAEKYFNGQLPLEDLARVVYKGVGAIAQEKIISALHKKLSDATAELASLKRAQPGSAGHVPHSNGAPDDSHLTPEQRRMQTFNRFVMGGQ